MNFLIATWNYDATLSGFISFSLFGSRAKNLIVISKIKMFFDEELLTSFVN